MVAACIVHKTYKHTYEMKVQNNYKSSRNDRVNNKKEKKNISTFRPSKREDKI